MVSEIIHDAYEKAKREYLRKAERMNSFKTQFTPEDFKNQFKIRAEMAMLERRIPGTFETDDDNRDILNLMFCYTAQQLTETMNPYNGVMLNGAYGCGKSIMMSAFCRVLNDLRMSADEQIEEIYSMDLAEYIKLKGSGKYMRKPLLIQDLGKENNFINAFGTKINPIGELLAIRAEYGALTYASSNFNRKSLEDRYETYVIDRFYAMTTVLRLPGKNRRTDHVIEKVNELDLPWKNK